MGIDPESSFNEKGPMDPRGPYPDLTSNARCRPCRFLLHRLGSEHRGVIIGEGNKPGQMKLYMIRDSKTGINYAVPVGQVLEEKFFVADDWYLNKAFKEKVDRYFWDGRHRQW